MSRFREVGDRVWVARYDWFDVNVGVVGGERGLLLVDTHASARAAREVVRDVRSLQAGEVVGIVNTHWHLDHTFGNGEVRAAYGAVPITAHEAAAEELAAGEARVREQYATGEDPRGEEVAGTTVVLPDDTFSSVRVVDLGDRVVELLHPGRGHTAGDLVASVPDAAVVLTGDLVEESGPPSLGEDCWPMEWPLTLDLVLDLVGPQTVVVPGHGAPVDRDFVARQRDDLGVVAETIRDLATRGVRVDDALTAGEWPWAPQLLAHAVRRGYEHLPRSQKRLPLL